MGLPDYPSFANWNPSLPDEMLRALGHLAVVSAQAEELLHQIYWNHAGLNEKTGPIVTDNLNPKRLEEDITKFVSLEKSKANILADLKILFAELRALNTKRNHCLHFIWIPPDPNADPPSHLGDGFRLKRPVYRQSGSEEQELTTQEIRAACNDFAWLTYRLRSHTFTDEQLREKRKAFGDFEINDGVKAVDIFWPAPWLDKPPLPAANRQNPPEQLRRSAGP